MYFQLVNTNVFSSSKYLCIFAKIKINYRKWTVVIKRARVFFLLLKICRYGHQKIRPSSQPIFNGKNPFFKIMKNSQVGAEKLGKTFFHFNGPRLHVF